MSSPSAGSAGTAVQAQRVVEVKWSQSKKRHAPTAKVEVLSFAELMKMKKVKEAAEKDVSPTDGGKDHQHQHQQPVMSPTSKSALLAAPEPRAVSLSTASAVSKPSPAITSSGGQTKVEVLSFAEIMKRKKVAGAPVGGGSSAVQQVKVAAPAVTRPPPTRPVSSSASLNSSDSGVEVLPFAEVMRRKKAAKEAEATEATKANAAAQSRARAPPLPVLPAPRPPTPDFD